MAHILSLRIGPGAGHRLDKALAASVPDAETLSRTRLAKLVAGGAVRVNGTVVTDPKTRVSERDAVEIVLPDPEPIDARPEAIPLAVVHEDDDVIVIDKPAGMVVHPAPGTPGGTLVNALLHHFGGELSGIGGALRPGIVHRIDKDTSGLLVVAKSDRAHHGLAAQFEAHRVDRLYTAICHGVPSAADPRLMGLRGVSAEAGGICVTTRLARHRHDRQRQAVTWDGGRHAVTRLSVSERFAGVARLTCRLETGRTHQIRAHLAHIGHPLIGDPTYGGRRRVSAKALGVDLAGRLNTFPRQALHAATLGFLHPVTGVRLSFEAALPDDLADILGALRAGPTPEPDRSRRETYDR